MSDLKRFAGESDEDFASRIARSVRERLAPDEPTYVTRRYRSSARAKFPGESDERFIARVAELEAARIRAVRHRSQKSNGAIVAPPPSSRPRASRTTEPPPARQASAGQGRDMERSDSRSFHAEDSMRNGRVIRMPERSTPNLRAQGQPEIGRNGHVNTGTSSDSDRYLDRDDLANVRRDIREHSSRSDLDLDPIRGEFVRTPPPESQNARAGTNVRRDESSVERDELENRDNSPQLASLEFVVFLAHEPYGHVSVELTEDPFASWEGDSWLLLAVPGGVELLERCRRTLSGSYVAKPGHFRASVPMMQLFKRLGAQRYVISRLRRDETVTKCETSYREILAAYGNRDATLSSRQDRDVRAELRAIRRLLQGGGGAGSAGGGGRDEIMNLVATLIARVEATQLLTLRVMREIGLESPTTPLSKEDLARLPQPLGGEAIAAQEAFDAAVAPRVTPAGDLEPVDGAHVLDLHRVLEEKSAALTEALASPGAAGAPVDEMLGTGFRLVLFAAGALSVDAAVETTSPGEELCLRQVLEAADSFAPAEAADREAHAFAIFMLWAEIFGRDQKIKPREKTAHEFMTRYHEYTAARLDPKTTWTVEKVEKAWAKLLGGGGAA